MKSFFHNINMYNGQTNKKKKKEYHEEYLLNEKHTAFLQPMLAQTQTREPNPYQLAG